MKIAIGCDHGGYDLKEHLVKFLQEQGHEVQDCGTYSKESCDYPIFGEAAARAVASGDCERGIVICTTGIGISIAANKVKGIRCACERAPVCGNDPPAQQRQYAGAGRRSDWPEYGGALRGSLFEHGF